MRLASKRPISKTQFAIIRYWYCRWIKFGKTHDFVFVGRETIATASGIYVSFLDLDTRERRIERFDCEERGDGASCLAGHPVCA